MTCGAAAAVVAEHPRRYRSLGVGLGLGMGLGLGLGLGLGSGSGFGFGLVLGFRVRAGVRVPPGDCGREKEEEAGSLGFA